MEKTKPLNQNSNTKETNTHIPLYSEKLRPKPLADSLRKNKYKGKNNTKTHFLCLPLGCFSVKLGKNQKKTSHYRNL